MAFLKFSRDKRGYEYFYLVQPSNLRGKSGSRLLYWFRSPPNVKVGREAFDPAVRRALERKNPDVTFDWPKLAATPLPAAEPERWRERRNTERAAKLAAQAEAGGDDPDVEREETPAVSVPVPEVAPLQAAESIASAVPTPDQAAEDPKQSARRRRRRRRGRRGRPSADPTGGTGGGVSAGSPELEPVQFLAPVEVRQSLEPLEPFGLREDDD